VGQEQIQNLGKRKANNTEHAEDESDDDMKADEKHRHDDGGRALLLDIDDLTTDTSVVSEGSVARTPPVRASIVCSHHTHSLVSD